MDLNERTAEAAERLRRIIRYARNIANERVDHGDLRTHLDEWAAYEEGGGLLQGRRQRWFNRPCPVVEGGRLLDHMDWVSTAAEEILKRASEAPKVYAKKHDLAKRYWIVVDHSIPVATIRAIISDTPELWSAKPMAEFLKNNFRRGILTKAEDTHLREGRLGERMPWRWRLGDDPFARYERLGIEGRRLKATA